MFADARQKEEPGAKSLMTPALASFNCQDDTRQCDDTSRPKCMYAEARRAGHHLLCRWRARFTMSSVQGVAAVQPQRDSEVFVKDDYVLYDSKEGFEQLLLQFDYGMERWISCFSWVRAVDTHPTGCSHMAI